MTISEALDLSILDVNIDGDVGGDPDAYVRALMAWHFGAETGSPYWLRRAQTLDFDPLTDVHGVNDLTLFPNVLDEFRDTPVADLIPRGLGPNPAIAGIYESGGTTGAPKRLVMFEEWFSTYLMWSGRMSASGLGGSGTNLLATVPTGPHMIGEITVRQAKALAGMRFTIDVDPRWVKKLISRGEAEQLSLYVDHLVDQAQFILETQDIGMIQTIPVLLERFAERPELVDLIRSKVKRIAWGGAHMNADTRDMLRNDVFPGIPIIGGYGSTTILSVAVERKEERADGLPVFDTFSPYVFMRVVNPDTGLDVAEGDRGQVVMNHITKYALLPNNLERDTAIKVAPLPGAIGCGVADVAPAADFAGGGVIEGVY